MSSPAASAPLAVLVLAWDETTPAARVLVEATEISTSYADSVVALVPTGLPSHALSQEEFLPLEASIPPPASDLAPGAPLAKMLAEAGSPEATATTEATATPPPLAEISLTDPASPTGVLPEPVTADPTEAVATPPSVAAATTAALVKPALVWQEVRVLRFSTYSPAALANASEQVAPTLVWAGAAGVPAAPYLGSSEPLLMAPGSRAAECSAVAASLLAAADTAATALVALGTLGLPDSDAKLLTNSVLPPLDSAYLPAELTAALDAEPDAAPTLTTDELVPNNAASATDLIEAATTAASLAVDVAPVQPVASITPPAPARPAPQVAEATFFAPAEAPELAVLRPPGGPFDAPNLNFQIIQYARLAVPRALAEQPFGAIYAPAWPTWLAAQELRHRSGQPLVLHLAQLAAADNELIDLAAGWPAEIQRQALHRADLILTETPALAQRLRHELTLPAHRVRCVPAADAAAVAQALRTAVRQ